MSFPWQSRHTHSYEPLSEEEKEENVHTTISPTSFVSLNYAVLLLLALSTFLNGALISLYSWHPVTDSNTPMAGPQLLYSPAQDIVEYRIQKFTRGLYDDVPIYEQPPSPEVDEAWEALYMYAPSKIPVELATQMPNGTWSIPEHKGYFLTALDVFHQIHCLDMLRQTIHHEQYPDLHLPYSHLRHCIGAIRQSLMCSSDISTVVWQWNETRGKAEQRDDVVHTCRNFEKIRDWAKDNLYENEPDLTQHVEWNLDS